MKSFDILVIGGGPGGYTAALMLAQQGKKVALFEKKKIGGSCLHVGCIPTKLLQSAASRYHALVKEGKSWGIEVENVRLNFQTLVDRTQKTLSILEKGIVSSLSTAGVQVIQGEAEILGLGLLKCGGEEYRGGKLILAMGSRPRHLPAFPIGGNIVTSDELLTQPRLPKSLLIVGAGVIGLEFACLYAQLGVKVRVGEVLPKLLPNMDEELGQAMLNSVRRLGVEVELGLEEVRPKDEEMILVSAGRVPNSDRAGVGQLSLKAPGGKIETNEFLETSAPDVFAIGDMTGKFPYAHTAYEHARIVSGRLKGGKEAMDDLKVPHVVFTSPEMSAIGLTEAEAKEIFKNVKILKRNFAANSKARILGEIQGWAKIVADGDTGRILGVHMVGPEATDLIGEACVLVSQKMTLEDLDKVVHPHPTLNEIFASH
ncbi:MAG TPA: FAD-dependent oxidoreductase [bacterium]|nr:FAD-dependent oxidoreductase [bacterium]